MAQNLTTGISARTQMVEIGHDRPTTITGEIINPTGRKKPYYGL
jgi:hypothetical protein